MPTAIDTITGSVTAPGSTFTPWTVATGDSLTVRNTVIDPAKPNWLLNAWAANNAQGSMRIRSPKLHDNVQGIRELVLPSDPEIFFPLGTAQKLYPQDTLVVEHSGSPTGGQIETGSLLVYYTDLPGAAARFIDSPGITKRGVTIETVPVSVTTGTTGGYSAAVALNSTVDLLIANTDYALVGYDLFVTSGGSLVPGSVCIRGADTANLRASGPASTNKKDVTAQWFQRLSDWFTMALIPVFNSANKAGILIDVTNNQTAMTVAIDLIFVQLAPM